MDVSWQVVIKVLLDSYRQCVANAMCRLMYSMIRLNKLFSSYTLYQQIRKSGQFLASDIPTYICLCNYQFKVYEKQSTIGFKYRCDDEYCLIALADTYRIFDSQHCILCISDAACAIMTVASGTYYMLDPHSHDVMGFQNDKGAAVLLFFQA